jgi:hypothetical protein
MTEFAYWFDEVCLPSSLLEHTGTRQSWTRYDGVLPFFTTAASALER